jgi:hypothetical protein
VINQEAAVNKSINKRQFFQSVDGRVNHVPYTTARATALSWLLEGHKVVCRDRLEGREGQGIRIIDPTSLGGLLQRPGESTWGWVARLLTASVAPTSEVLGASRLWTRFIPSQDEYRVHVVNGRTIAVHRKVEGTNNEVRNTENGWEFRRVSRYPEAVSGQGNAAIAAIGLDFGAVDILWDGSQAWVLETNTAPGIDGMTWTIEQYSIALKELIRERWQVTSDA